VNVSAVAPKTKHPRQPYPRPASCLNRCPPRPPTGRRECWPPISYQHPALEEPLLPKKFTAPFPPPFKGFRRLAGLVSRAPNHIHSHQPIFIFPDPLGQSRDRPRFAGGDPGRTPFSALRTDDAGTSKPAFRPEQNLGSVEIIVTFRCCSSRAPGLGQNPGSNVGQWPFSAFFAPRGVGHADLGLDRRVWSEIPLGPPCPRNEDLSAPGPTTRFWQQIVCRAFFAPDSYRGVEFNGFECGMTTP